MKVDFFLNPSIILVAFTTMQINLVNSCMVNLILIIEHFLNALDSNIILNFYIIFLAVNSKKKVATNKRFHVKKWLLFLITFAFVVTTMVCNEWKQKKKGLKVGEP